jgi:adenine-specific DNA-methyltransferase
MDNNIAGSSEKAEIEFKKQYPAVYNHLLQFKVQLSARNKEETGIRYEWYALQRWGANYRDDFFKPKIVWIELADKGRFFYDKDENYFTLNGTFIMTGDDLEYLLCILNNPITSWHFNTFCISSGVGTNQWRELYVKELFAPSISKVEQVIFINTYREISRLKSLSEATLLIEQELNKIVYNLFELSQEEIQFIENQ